jgi:hypothetical protein
MLESTGFFFFSSFDDDNKSETKRCEDKEQEQENRGTLNLIDFHCTFYFSLSEVGCV